MMLFIIGVFLLFINIGGLGNSTVLRILPILIFSVTIFNNLLSRNNYVFQIVKEFKWLILLIVIVTVGIFFNQRTDISFQYKFFNFLVFITFSIAFILTIWKTSNIQWSFASYIYWPFILFIFLNLIIYVLGIKDESMDIGEAIMLSYLGISIDRVKFILSPGINAYGTICGIGLIFSLICFKFSKSGMIIAFLGGALVCFISLLLTDSRGPLIYSIFTFIVLSYYWKSLKPPKFLWMIPIISIIGPVLLLTLLTLLSSTEFAQYLARSSGDLATGNSRSIIWLISVSEFFNFKTSHIFGYGEYGHFSSGLSQNWAFVFGDQDGSELMHPHNTLLSVVLDYGYFGLFVFFVVQYIIVNAIKMSWVIDRFMSFILLGILLYFNLVGIGETMFGFYYQNSLYLYISICVFAVVTRYRSNFVLNKFYFL